MEDDEFHESWGRIKREVVNIENRHESCILIGDFNRAIGAGKLGVQGNKPKISPGGRLVRELVENGEYILANNLEKATGGPWTWICRADGAIRICLDLVIISADLEPYLSSLVINTEFKYAPFRVRRIRKGVTRKIYPDHYPLIVRFNNLPMHRIKEDRVSNWNLNVPEGWKKYQELSDKIAENMNTIIEDESLDIEAVKKRVDALQSKIKFQAFGKTKPSTARDKKQTLEGRHKSAYGMDGEKEKEDILGQQAQAIEDAINKLNAEKHGRVTNVFNVSKGFWINNTVSIVKKKRQ